MGKMNIGYIVCDNCGNGFIPVDVDKLSESDVLCADCAGYNEAEFDREDGIY